MTPARAVVLISCAGRRVELLRIWRRTLADLRLPGEILATDVVRASAAFHDADRAFTVPPCTDPAFIPEMLALCRREAVTLVIPTIDTELPMLADARARFAEIGTTIHVSAPETIAIGSDKRATYRWLTDAGFPTIRQAEPEQILDGRTEDWTFPAIAKPAHGSSSIGLSVVRSREELAWATRGGDFIVQSIAAGVEYTVDVLVDRLGRCRGAVPRRRLEVRAGEVSKGMTVREPAVIDLATRVAEALPGAWGCLNVQIFHDAATGALAVIELNPRFGGGFPLAWEAGARYPEGLLAEVLGRPATSHDEWTEGLVMLRYDAAVFRTREACGV